MSAQQFQGNIPVSTAKQVYRGRELGREGFVKQAVVNKAIPIREEGDFPVESNSEILFGRFSEEFAVKGLVHDAAVNLYSRETGFRSLGVDPSENEMLEILEGSVKGTKHTTPDLKQKISSLETKYDIQPDEVLKYSFSSGETVSDLLQEVANYRHGNWIEQTSGFEGVDSEETLFEDGLSGRIDLLYSGFGDNPAQVREIKTSGETSRFDEFQVSAYWLMQGDEEAEAVVDYPLIDEQLVFDPFAVEEENDFNPREYAFDVYRSRDKAVEVIDDLRELQMDQFGKYNSREEATREALRELEVW